MEQEVYLEFDRLEGKHWWFRGRRKYLKSLIRRLYSRFISEGAELNFCEIGSGTGGNLSMLTEFATVDAVEMNELARELIRQKKNERVRGVQFGSLPDSIPLQGRYDGVFSLDVIEHVEQDLMAIKQLAKLVKPNGYIITTVPAYQWLWSQHDVANHHKRRYTLKRYRSLFIEAGLEVHYASYFNTLLFPLAVLGRIGSRIKPRSNDQAVISMPGFFLNSVLHSLFSLESYWAARAKIPFGLSIVVVATTATSEKVLHD